MPVERPGGHQLACGREARKDRPQCATVCHIPPPLCDPSHFTVVLCRSKPWPGHICQGWELRHPGNPGFGLLLNDLEGSPHTNKRPFNHSPCLGSVSSHQISKNSSQKEQVSRGHGSRALMHGGRAVLTVRAHHCSVRPFWK